MTYTDPLVKFDYNQKVYVYIDDDDVSYLPCIPIDESIGGPKMTDITRIPNKAWITYKGLGRFYGQTCMRFAYAGDIIFLGLGCLKFMEDISQRKPHDKVKSLARTVSSITSSKKAHIVNKRTSRSAGQRKTLRKKR